MDIANKFNVKKYKEKAYKLFSEYYTEIGELEYALRAYQNYMTIKDSRQKQNSKKEFLLLYHSFQTLLELKDKEMQLELKKQAIKESRRNKILLIIAIILIFIFFIMIIIVVRYNYLYKRSEYKLKQLANASLEGLILHDGKKILDINDTFAKMTGYTKDELIGKPLDDIVSERSIRLIRQNADMNKTIFYDEVYLKRKDGKEFETEILSKPFPYNNIKAKVVSVRDVETIKQAVREMELIKLRFKTILDTFPDGIILTDNQGYITFVSLSVVNIFEADNKDVFIGKRFSDFINPEYKNIAEKDFDRIILGQFEGISEYKAKKFTDEEIILECNGSAFRNSDGSISGTFMVLRDVSFIRYTENSLIETETRFRNLYQEAKDAIIIYDDKEDLIVDANNATVLLTGYEYYDLLDMSIFDFIEIDKKKLDLNKLVYTSHPTQVPLKTRFLKKLITHITVSEVHYAKKEYFMLIIRDITDFVKQQQELERIAKELSATNKMKDKLFSIIAHDLRGPIGNMKTMMEFIAENPESFDPEEILELVDSMRKTSVSTYELLENLLSWAKSKQNMLEYKPTYVNIANLISTTTELFNPIASNKKIKLETIFPNNNTEVIADENMIKTVLRNLISNAIKFTNSGGKVTISFSTEENFVTVQVADTGVGIPSDKISKLFDSNTFITTYGTNKEKGTGLGLKLCKDFINRHKGKIWVKTIPGKGTSFFFTLKKIS